MKKAIFCTFVCMLMVLSMIVSVSGIILTGKTSHSEKPDLIVEVIGFTRKDVHSPVEAYATIKNIGNVTIENGTFYLEYVFTRMVLGIIPIITRNDTIWIQMNGSLEPGELLAFVNIGFVCDLPKWGFFEFKCTVNPGFTIEESNYDNNDLAKNYIVILGHWKPIE